MPERSSVVHVIIGTLSCLRVTSLFSVACAAVAPSVVQVASSILSLRIGHLNIARQLPLT